MRKVLLVFALSWIVLFCLLGVSLGAGLAAYVREARAALKLRNSLDSSKSRPPGNRKFLPSLGFFAQRLRGRDCS
jgi:hypothetical protein